VQVLVNALMLWVIGSQPSKILIEGHAREMIEFGIGHLKAVVSDGHFNDSDEANFPVYIAEPLIILHLRSLFERQSWTQRTTWLSNSMLTARNKSSIGTIFEEATMMVLIQNFGGKYTALDKVFHLGTSSPLGSREVTLVSLTRGTGDEMLSSEISWSKGSSDCVGFKAQSVENVLEFFADPKGKPFLFPDIHMGPDVVAFFVDKETQELIMFLVQAKSRPKLNFSTWMNALESITPDLFYSMKKVRLRRSSSYCMNPLFLHLQRDGKRVQYAPIAYPDLKRDMEGLLENMLGSDEYQPVANRYCSKLRSANHEPPPIPKREVPRYLRIVASPDDKQEHRLLAEPLGNVVTLKWDVVTECIGSVAESVRDSIVTVH
jgi:hypothetical protein